MDATLPGPRMVTTRCVSFFAEPGQVSEVERRINNDVLPRFSSVQGFLGFLALLSNGSRREIIAMSFWDGGLEGSEEISEIFRDEIERVTGAAPARKEFRVITMVMRSEGTETVGTHSPAHKARSDDTRLDL
jgi:hypothetical protein